MNVISDDCQGICAHMHSTRKYFLIRGVERYATCTYNPVLTNFHKSAEL